MAIVILLVILWTPYVVSKLLRPRPASTSRVTRPQSECDTPPNGQQSATNSDDRSLWTALDERQLTRLLIDAAPRTTTE